MCTLRGVCVTIAQCTSKIIARFCICNYGCAYQTSSSMTSSLCGDLAYLFYTCRVQQQLRSALLSTDTCSHVYTTIYYTASLLLQCAKGGASILCTGCHWQQRHYCQHDCTSCGSCTEAAITATASISSSSTSSSSSCTTSEAH
jgi:hypothetical protein